MIPEEFRDLVERPLLAHLATTGPTGAPNVNPMWFVWDGACIKMTHTKERQKFQNIAREPRVAISIVDPDKPQRYIEIRGTVESVVDDLGGAFYQTLRERYGSGSGPIRDAHVRVVLTIRPTTVFTRTVPTGAREAHMARHDI